MSKKIEIYTMRGPAGVALVVEDTRVCGPKAWGGGTILHEFEVDKKELYEALRKPPTKRQLWRRVARLAGELLWGSGLESICVSGKSLSPQGLRDAMRDRFDSLSPETARRLAKLETALKAYEECPE